MPHGAIPYPFGDCRICADKATGVHYGVATCEGCKGFFKRSLPKGDKYKCFFGGQCKLSPQNRNRCKACRFQRCLSMGMSTDAVKMGRIPKVDKERALEQHRREIDTDTMSKALQQTHGPHPLASVANHPPYPPHPAFPNHMVLNEMEHHRSHAHPQSFYPHSRLPPPPPGGRFHPDGQPYHHLNHRREQVHRHPVHDRPPHEHSVRELPNHLPHSSTHTSHSESDSDLASKTLTEVHAESSRLGIHQHLGEAHDRDPRQTCTEDSHEEVSHDRSREPHSGADKMQHVADVHRSPAPHLSENEPSSTKHHSTVVTSHHAPPSHGVPSHLSPPGGEHPRDGKLYGPHSHYMKEPHTSSKSLYPDPMPNREPALHHMPQNYPFPPRLHHDMRQQQEPRSRDMITADMGRHNLHPVSHEANGIGLNERNALRNPNMEEPPVKVRRMSYPMHEMSNGVLHRSGGRLPPPVAPPMHKATCVAYDSGFSDSGSDGLANSPQSTKSTIADQVNEQDRTCNKQPCPEVKRDSCDPLQADGQAVYENSTTQDQEDARQFKSPSVCSSRPQSHTPTWSSSMSSTSSRPSSRGLYSPGIIRELFHKVMETGSVNNLKIALNKASSVTDLSGSTISTCLTPDGTLKKSISDTVVEEDVKPNIDLVDDNLAQSKAFGMEKFLNDSVERSKACMVQSELTDVKTEIIDDEEEYGKMTSNGFIDYEEKGMDLAPIIISSGDSTNLEDATSSLISRMNGSCSAKPSSGGTPSKTSRNHIDTSDYLNVNSSVDSKTTSMDFSSDLDEDNITLVRSTLSRLQKSFSIFDELLQGQFSSLNALQSGKSKPHRLNMVTTPTKEDCHEMWEALFQTIPGANKVILSICTNIPAFNRLQSEDQALLLKRAYYEIWLIVRSKLFQDGETYLWLSNGAYYSQMWMRRFLPLRLIQKYYNFTNEINKCNLSHLELTIICAIRLTDTDVSGLKNLDQVRLLHNHYLDVLAYTVQQNHKANGGRILINIIQTMPLLSAINEEQAKIVGNFTADKPPNLLEANLKLEREEREEQQRQLAAAKKCSDEQRNTKELASLLHPTC